MDATPPLKVFRSFRKGNLLCHAKHFVTVYEALQKLTSVNNVLMTFEVVIATSLCMIRQYRLS